MAGKGHEHAGPLSAAFFVWRPPANTYTLRPAPTRADNGKLVKVWSQNANLRIGVDVCYVGRHAMPASGQSLVGPSKLGA